MKDFISVLNETQFNELALETFHYQVKTIPIYSTYVKSLHRLEPQHYTEIPCLPISFFKTHRVCKADLSPEIVFKSSGTTGQIRSKHFVEDLSVYEKSFTHAYRALLGNPENQVILGLLPSYVEQGDSSLVYMVQSLINLTKNPLSGFLLHAPEIVEERYQKALTSGKEVIIFGVSYALLDLAEKNVDLSKARIIETGGMKGRRKEITKEELHETLKNGLSVPFISSEYGMTELLSQAYSNQQGLFDCPPWMKILIRDVNDPFSLINDGRTGGINVIDLANKNSCSFIATQDLGKNEGDKFRIMGRFDNADVRGCNLLVG